MSGALPTARTYVARNLRKVLPIFGIQCLVTALMVAILTATNAFETTSEVYVRPLEAYTLVAPRSRSDFDEDLLALLRSNPALASEVPAKSLWMRAPMLVGEGTAPLLALPTEAQPGFLERVGLRVVAGRLPRTGEDGAVVHEAILAARGLALGDAFGQNVREVDAMLDRFTIVGVVRGEARVGLVDQAYVSRAGSVLARLPTFRLVVAKEGRKAESDRWLREAMLAGDARAFRVFDESRARAHSARMLANLPLLLGFITLCIALVVALVTALLQVLAFQARIEEIALLLAVGHRRSVLGWRLAREQGLVAFAGFALGVALGIAAVWAFDVGWLRPRGILVQVPDLRPVLYAACVPLLSVLVSVVVVRRRLARTDPVTILQRQGAAA